MLLRHNDIDFNRWLETVGNSDYTTNNYYIQNNNFSINYPKHGDPDNNPSVDLSLSLKITTTQIDPIPLGNV